MKKNLFIPIICAIFAGAITSCTLFKVVTGRVVYKDPTHQMETSVDTMVIVNAKQVPEYVK